MPVSAYQTKIAKKLSDRYNLREPFLQKLSLFEKVFCVLFLESVFWFLKLKIVLFFFGRCKTYLVDFKCFGNWKKAKTQTKKTKQNLSWWGGGHHTSSMRGGGRHPFTGGSWVSPSLLLVSTPIEGVGVGKTHPLRGSPPPPPTSAGGSLPLQRGAVGDGVTLIEGWGWISTSAEGTTPSMPLCREEVPPPHPFVGWRSPHRPPLRGGEPSTYMHHCLQQMHENFFFFFLSFSFFENGFQNISQQT